MFFDLHAEAFFFFGGAMLASRVIGLSSSLRLSGYSRQAVYKEFYRNRSRKIKVLIEKIKEFSLK